MIRILLPLSAQERLLPVFHFYRLSTADGLPTTEIRSSVGSDRNGFIWIGTVNGLARYDGYSCKVYCTIYRTIHIRSLRKASTPCTWTAGAFSGSARSTPASVCMMPPMTGL